MSHSELQVLLRKYLLEELSEEEFRDLWLSLEDPSKEAEWNDLISEIWNKEALHNLSDVKAKERVESRLNVLVEKINIKPFRIIGQRMWWAAAALLILLGVGGYYLRSYDKTRMLTESKGIDGNQRYKNDVEPGGEKAILTLADGSTIVLDSAANGILNQQGNVRIIKLSNGELSYKIVGENSNVEVFHNTMTTPRGGQYSLRLPDGSKVWLNASSSITYPTAFRGGERKVSMKGEAYFEIARDTDRPFYVETDGATISVLGTHFNVNAYKGEAMMKTTLLEGSVKISSDGFSDILRPGDQAQIKPGGNIKVVNDVDTDDAIAWKNGYFQFVDADMQSVMKELERWYDIDVSYEGAIPKRSFSGGIQRTLPLSKVLTILEENEVKFLINGRKIEVLK